MGANSGSVEKVSSKMSPCVSVRAKLLIVYTSLFAYLEQNIGNGLRRNQRSEPGLADCTLCIGQGTD